MSSPEHGQTPGARVEYDDAITLVEREQPTLPKAELVHLAQLPPESRPKLRS